MDVEVTARSVIIATGARYRKLDVPRLAEFETTSVYYAATRFEAQECGSHSVAVVGGGNSAGQATVFLAQTASRVYLVTRDDDLRRHMSQYLIDQVNALPNVEVVCSTEVRSRVGTTRSAVSSSSRRRPVNVESSRSAHYSSSSEPPHARAGWRAASRWTATGSCSPARQLARRELTCGRCCSNRAGRACSPRATCGADP